MSETLPEPTTEPLPSPDPVPGPEPAAQPRSQVRVRRDSQSLLGEGQSGAAVFDKYALAVHRMRALDPPGGGEPTEPLGWRYQAALHGIADAAGGPIRTDDLWNACRHNSWFFLAWHRLYLLRFEAIVRHVLQDDSWALPYWDYTKPDDIDARRIPAPFRTDSPGNELFTAQRRPEMNQGFALPTGTWDARPALAVPDFALPRFDPRPTFGGGIVADVVPTANARGALEGVPHGTVHSVVSGWMGAFETAALDPLFWLHHANIDRLWEVWLRAGHANTADPAWLGTSFTFYDVEGERQSLDIASILDTSELGYSYESVSTPALAGLAGRPPRESGAAALGPIAGRRREGVAVPAPELLGATSDVMMGGTTTVAIAMDAPHRPSMHLAADVDAPEPLPRWFLRVENVVGRPRAAAFGVYLNVEEQHELDERRFVGTIAAFGIAEASRVDDAHDGAGLTDVFDVTDTVSVLAERGEWDEGTVRVTIVPLGMTEEPVEGGEVRAGRVSVYRG